MDPRSSIPPHLSQQQQQHGNFPNMAPTTQSLPPSVQCSPIFVEYQLMKEFVLFQKQTNLSHVYLVPSHSSAFDWFGVFFIHRGLYSEMVLRFTVHISKSYPNCDVPKIIFDPIPPHPLVDQNTGELNTSLRFTKWNSTNNFIFEIIAFAKEVFELDDVNEFKKCSNGELRGSNYETTQLRELLAQIKEKFNGESIQKVGDDKHSINFTEPENPLVIEKLRSKLLSDKGPFEAAAHEQYNKPNTYNGSGLNYGSPAISGLSWTKKIVYK